MPAVSILVVCLALAFAVVTGVQDDDRQYSELQCSFDKPNLCGLENDRFYISTTWARVNFLATVVGGIISPSLNGLGYGPFSDHSGDSYYAAATGTEGAVARLLTPVITGSRDAPVTVVSFSYHIGSNLAKLTVKIVHDDRSKPFTAIWSTPEDGPVLGRGDSWFSTRITINYPAQFRIAFEAEMNSVDESVYVAIDDVFLQNGELLKICDFEGSIFGDLCHFYQADMTDGSVDDFDWTRQNGETPSLDTGPLFDHTMGEGASGHYLFIEATRPEEDKTAVLYSLEYYKNDMGSCKLEFYYHAYGANIGTLNVLVADRGYSLDLKSEDVWKRHEIDISYVTGRYRVAFQGVRGNGNLGDIAIDDISFVGESCTGIDVCASSPCLNGGTCTQVGDTFKCECMGRDTQPNCIREEYLGEASIKELKCNFLPLDLCQWESVPISSQDETTIQWTREKATTLKAGPLRDHSGDRFYARAIGQDDVTARFLTSVLSGSQYSPYSVLSFWYHIGSKMSNLTVQIVHANPSKTRETVWAIPADGIVMRREDPWLMTRMNINCPSNFQIAFEALINDSNRTYVAVDDVLVLSGTKEVPHSCDFEVSAYGDLCFFDQESEDDFDWARHHGETPTSGTGPSFDHTLGENKTGRYLYIEAAGAPNGSKAILQSLKFFKVEGDDCILEFYFYAVGANLGELNVTVSDRTYQISLPNIDEWVKYDIDLADVSGYYTIAFVGVRGDGDSGDIAIDDINLAGENCMVADACGSLPCANGGSCIRLGMNYKCDCLPGYPGLNCEAEAVRESLSSLIILAICVGCGGIVIVLLTITYLIWANWRRNNKNYAVDKASDTAHDGAELEISNEGGMEGHCDEDTHDM